jgi:hypothetical protein
MLKKWKVREGKERKNEKENGMTVTVKDKDTPALQLIKPYAIKTKVNGGTGHSCSSLSLVQSGIERSASCFTQLDRRRKYLHTFQIGSRVVLSEGGTKREYLLLLSAIEPQFFGHSARLLIVELLSHSDFK